jgi:hypothetical protein
MAAHGALGERPQRLGDFAMQVEKLGHRGLPAWRDPADGAVARLIDG